MPNIRSAKKALRQSLRRKEKNVSAKKKVKDTLKKYKKAVAAGSVDEAKAQLPTVYKTLDKAAKTKLMKKNTVSRLKSRLTKKLSAAPEVKPKKVAKKK